MATTPLQLAPLCFGVRAPTPCPLRLSPPPPGPCAHSGDLSSPAAPSSATRPAAPGGWRYPDVTKPAAPALVARRGTRGHPGPPLPALQVRYSGDLPAALRVAPGGWAGAHALRRGLRPPAPAGWRWRPGLAHGRTSTGTQHPEPPNWPHWDLGPGLRVSQSSRPTPSGYFSRFPTASP